LVKSRESAKHKIASAAWSLKIPPQPEMPGFPFDAPSMLHLNQEGRVGCHIISLI